MQVGCIWVHQLQKPQFLCMYFLAGLHLHLCQWMVIVAAMLIPLTWAGTPKDFWPIAVGALITTVVACILIIVSCVLKGTNELETVEFPAPTFTGSFKGKTKMIIDYNSLISR